MSASLDDFIATGDFVLNDEDLLQKSIVTTLRLPIFCKENKPFIFIKVVNDSEKFRVSVNPEFLRNYNLNFKILRDVSLMGFIHNLKPEFQKLIRFNHSVSQNLLANQFQEKDPNESLENFQNVSLFLRLPKKEFMQVQKHTILLENDDESGKTLIDKYLFSNDQNGQTVIYIIEREYQGIRNLSLSFISDTYKTIHDFLNWYKLSF